MKNKRKKFKEHKFQQKAGFKDEHHLTPKSRGGAAIGSNLLNIDAYKHDALHLLFGNRTLDEIIEFLERLRRAKENEQFRYYK